MSISKIDLGPMTCEDYVNASLRLFTQICEDINSILLLYEDLQQGADEHDRY